ncbi:MAG: AFG3 family protein, partial [Cyclobacteriaceae bacterium]
KPYSEATAELIDKEVKDLIDKAYERTKDLLKDKNEQLEIVAKELLDKEIIFQADLERLIGPRPFEKPTTYQEFTNGIDDEEKEVGEDKKPDETIDEIKESVKNEVENETSQESTKQE